MGLRQSIAGTAEWAAHVGSDVGCSPIAYLRFSLIVRTSSTRVVLLDFDGRTGLVFFVEGLPDMNMVTRQRTGERPRQNRGLLTGGDRSSRFSELRRGRHARQSRGNPAEARARTNET